ASMNIDDVLCIFHQPAPKVEVSKKVADCVIKRIFIAHLNRSTTLDELSRERREIFHVRSEHDRLAGHNRLNWILTANRSQAFADEYHRGNRVPAPQFARPIEYQTKRLAIRGRVQSTAEL